ncbi:MAG: hypothetical protein JXB47_09305 [Anaerolineae bacterium]|nr:hypothetical protein [Anaerolineae bacterium]
MRSTSTAYNIASIVVVVLTVLVLVFYCLILVGVINPFPPRPLPTRIPVDTPVPVTPALGPTWTPGGAESETGGDTGQANTPPIDSPVAVSQTTGGTRSVEPEPTPAAPFPTEAPSPAPAETTEDGDTFQNPVAEPEYPFGIQGAGPAFMPQFVYPAAGCNWQGIAGQVFGLQGEELTQNLVVHVWGEDYDDLVAVGQSLAYGESGWESFLGNATNSGVYYVQLLHQDARQLSDVVRVEFSDSCAGNLATVYFQQKQGF